MNVWAIADLHLAISTPDKNMDVFGWTDYMKKIEKNWRCVVKDEDLVLIAGDISWAMNLDKAKIDLNWIEALPGTKVMIKGNHDYWWQSIGKTRAILGPKSHLIQNDAFHFEDISIAGTRLWDSDEYSFYPQNLTEEEQKQNSKIFERELERLEMSLKALRKEAQYKIAMTHYPPIGADLKPSKTSALLEKYGVDFCIFGHLHNVKENELPFGKKNGVDYRLTSCDHLNFTPLKII